MPPISEPSIAASPSKSPNSERVTAIARIKLKLRSKEMTDLRRPMRAMAMLLGMAATLAPTADGLVSRAPFEVHRHHALKSVAPSRADALRRATPTAAALPPAKSWRRSLAQRSSAAAASLPEPDAAAMAAAGQTDDAPRKRMDPKTRKSVVACLLSVLVFQVCDRRRRRRHQQPRHATVDR